MQLPKFIPLLSQIICLLMDLQLDSDTDVVIIKTASRKCKLIAIINNVALFLYVSRLAVSDRF